MENYRGISPLAVVESTDIGKNVRIDEFAIVRKSVKIGQNVTIHPHAVINPGVVLNDGVEIFTGAVIGKEHQELGTLRRTPDSDRYLIIGSNSSIGSHTVLYYATDIGADTIIDGHCEIGYPTSLSEGKPLIIGKGSLIRSHSLFYTGSAFGSKLVTGHRVTVREGTKAGENFQIGTLSDIQGDCTIGNYVRLHSNVHIGKRSQIGNFVWIFPYVVLTNDPTPPSEALIGVEIKDFAVIATMSVILPGIVIGSHTLVGAHSLVSENVPDGMAVGGVRAKDIGRASDIKLRDGSGRPSYPWKDRFYRGYPEEIVREWKSSSAEVDFE